MSLLAPAALAVGLLALPIIALYMLRLRRREQVVSSTFLWRQLMQDRTANAPWQRLRRNLLLLLQLLVLAALAVALARPAVERAGIGGGSLIVLLDASASMQATDGVDGTRFDDARAEVARLIAGLAGADRMTLIRVAATPVVLAATSNDHNALRQALAAAAPDNTAADWPAAFALAAGSARGLGNPRIVVISDGGLPDDLPALPGEVAFVPVGRAGDNLALTAQAARRSASGADLLVSVQNSGETPRSGLLSLYLDGSLFDSRRIDLAAGEQAAQSWLLPANAGIAEARLAPRDGAADYLDVDNQAWTVLSGNDARRVLLLGEGNVFLERLFAVLPGYEVVRASEGSTGEAGGYDLYVYDSVVVPDTLPGNALIFNPQPGPAGGDAAPLLTVGGVFTETMALRLASSPLLANVDWGTVNIAEARQVAAPGLEPLVETPAGPLLMAGEVDGRRAAVFTFDLRASDLPLQIAFPVIMANITAWLSPGRVIATDEILQPGATVTIIPDARAAAVIVTLPDGTEWRQTVNSPGEPLLFAATRQPGVYRVNFEDGSSATRPGGAFAVNFFNADESRILPVATLSVGRTEVTGNELTGGLRELWPWLLGIGLGGLLVEWWITYRRSQGRPAFKLR